MPTSYDLEMLRSKKEAAFDRKQAAWDAYAVTRTEEYEGRIEAAHAAMVKAWEKLEMVRVEMDDEYEKLRLTSKKYRQVWDEYDHIYENNASAIKLLREEADREHEQMQDYFEQAAKEYESGDKAKSAILAAEGREHGKRRNELNVQIKKHCDVIRVARQKTIQDSPRIDSSAYRAVREVHAAAKVDYKKAKSEFLCLKKERDRLREIYLTAKDEFYSIREQYRLAIEDFENG